MADRPQTLICEHCSKIRDIAPKGKIPTTCAECGGRLVEHTRKELADLIESVVHDEPQHHVNEADSTISGSEHPLGVHDPDVEEERIAEEEEYDDPFGDEETHEALQHMQARAIALMEEDQEAEATEVPRCKAPESCGISPLRGLPFCAAHWRQIPLDLRQPIVNGPPAPGDLIRAIASLR